MSAANVAPQISGANVAPQMSAANVAPQVSNRKCRAAKDREPHIYIYLNFRPFRLVPFPDTN
jgi:hypothetical protein